MIHYLGDTYHKESEDEYKMDKMESMVFNVKDLQTVLGVGRDTAYALMRNKSFPAIKIGSRYIVEAEAFKQWLKRSAGKEIYL